jgi:hypothetical protein
MSDTQKLKQSPRVRNIIIDHRKQSLAPMEVVNPRRGRVMREPADPNQELIFIKQKTQNERNDYNQSVTGTKSNDDH